jgi:DNA-binding response OmpR family regulator
MAKILVVEDDPDMLALIVRRLRQADHRVLDALSGAAATAVLEEKGVPDVVVLDVTLPDVNGFELLGMLRAQTEQPDLPAVFLSGRVLQADITAGRALNAFYLTKPFNATALLGAVDAVLDSVRVAAPKDW